MKKYYLRKVLRFCLLITVTIVLVSCESRKEKISEIKIIRSLYNIPCYEFRLDSLKSIDEIGKFSDSICLAHKGEQDIIIGFPYNLCDSSFTPSPDTMLNCIIPCGLSVPSHGKISYDGQYSFISKITSDSMTIQFFNSIFPTRIHINEFKVLYKKYLQILFIKNHPKNIERISTTIDISNNPPKKAFCKVFNTLFWTYYNESFIKLKTYPSADLEEIAREVQIDPMKHHKSLNGVYILLSSDSTGKDYRHPLLSH